MKPQDEVNQAKSTTYAGGSVITCGAISESDQRSRLLAQTARTTVASDLAYIARTGEAQYRDAVLKAVQAFELPDAYWLERFQGKGELTLRQWCAELQGLDIERTRNTYAPPVESDEC